MVDYPPVAKNKLEALKREMRLVPVRHKEDALQEAWVAHLEGRNPVSAVKVYVRQEVRQEHGQGPISQFDKPMRDAMDDLLYAKRPEETIRRKS